MALPPLWSREGDVDVDAVVRIVIEDADGVTRVTADRPVQVLLVRYDDLLVEPQLVECDVSVNPRRVERLFRDPDSAAEE